METSAKKSLRSFYWTWVILTAVGVGLSLWLPRRYMPAAMSNDAHLTMTTMILFSICAAPVASGVYAGALHVLRHHRYRGDGVPPPAPQIRESTKLLTSWITASAILTVFVLVWGLGALAAENGSSSSNPLVVNVTGQQWVWTFSYPGTHVVSDELYLPENREVEFRVTSLDVTHGFWLVNMGVQVDANPDVITTIHTTPDKLGVFEVRCEQFCGLNHAFMDAVGYVVTPQKFSSWLSAQPARA
ncbi:MAG: cytochrome c oxidase, subunit [Acidimicrobiaceae bacterium]|nr:cytochrome c oxidase, subunit [Acidimicrobiaceae bacterium]